MRLLWPSVSLDASKRRTSQSLFGPAERYKYKVAPPEPSAQPPRGCRDACDACDATVPTPSFYMWPRLLSAARPHAELWSLPLLLIATTLPSFDVLCMNRNARVPRAANRGKRAVSHHNRKAKRPRKGTPTLNKRGR